MEPLKTMKKIGFEKQPDLFLLLNRVRMKAWFLHDSVFKLPKSFLFVKFSWGFASTSPKQSALTHLLVLLIQVSTTNIVLYIYFNQFYPLIFTLFESLFLGFLKEDLFYFLYIIFQRFFYSTVLLHLVDFLLGFGSLVCKNVQEKRRERERKIGWTERHVRKENCN